MDDGRRPGSPERRSLNKTSCAGNARYGGGFVRVVLSGRERTWRVSRSDQHEKQIETTTLAAPAPELPPSRRLEVLIPAYLPQGKNLIRTCFSVSVVFLDILCFLFYFYQCIFFFFFYFFFNFYFRAFTFLAFCDFVGGVVATPLAQHRVWTVLPSRSSPASSEPVWAASWANGNQLHASQPSRSDPCPSRWTQSESQERLADGSPLMAPYQMVRLLFWYARTRWPEKVCSTVERGDAFSHKS